MGYQKIDHYIHMLYLDFFGFSIYLSWNIPKKYDNDNSMKMDNLSSSSLIYDRYFGRKITNNFHFTLYGVLQNMNIKL